MVEAAVMKLAFANLASWSLRKPEGKLRKTPSNHKPFAAKGLQLFHFKSPLPVPPRLLGLSRRKKSTHFSTFIALRK